MPVNIASRTLQIEKRLSLTKRAMVKSGGRSRKLISSDSEFEARSGYSRAAVFGDYVFVSGATGYDYATMSISDVVEFIGHPERQALLAVCTMRNNNDRQTGRKVRSRRDREGTLGCEVTTTGSTG